MARIYLTTPPSGDTLGVARERELDGYFTGPEDAPAKWLVMITAYLDESGHETKGWTFLAGFLGTERDWMDFIPKWKAALGGRKFLHMNRLRWHHDRTRKLLARLGPVPEQSGLIPILGGAQFADYEDIVSGRPEEKTLKGYMACLFYVLTAVLRQLPDDQRLELVFEEQRQYRPFADLAFRIFADPVSGPREFNMTVDGRPKLAKWSFVPKGSTIMTDAADYYAFALREKYVNGENSRKARWCSSILDTNDGIAIGRIMSRDEIRAEIRSAYALAAQRELDRQIAKLTGLNRDR